ncbi:MAG: di-trans,poly-cis-decaprenylcistransferase [Clostridia bacterium]|nr:di-trans,poly-cis-decaprenylcistransferase [Clostridia bacterium]
MAKKIKENELIKADEHLKSVAVIMDGNGRWAKKRLLPRTAGHKAGAANVEKMLMTFREMGVHHVTIYAFSTENWKRPREEVEALMELTFTYLQDVVMKKIEAGENFRVHFLGDKSALPERLRAKCVEVEGLNPDSDYICNVALNYGGRAEIVHAANEAIKAGHTEITEEILTRYMYTSESPDPDLIIRTGGDFRISNFLLWQCAYSEIVVTDTLFPDFDRDAINDAVKEFYSRKRRFGGVEEEK